MNEEDLINALMKADADGDTEGAQILADELNKVRASASSQPKSMETVPLWQRPFIAAADTARLAGSGLGLGFSEKALAGIKSMVGSGTYEENLAAERAATQAARDRAGSAGIVTETGAKMVGPMKAMGALGAYGQVPQAAGLPSRLMAALGIGGLEGGAVGAIEAAGNDRDVVKEAKKGAAFGAIAGPAVEGISTAANNVFRNRYGENRTPSIDSIRTAKDDAYQAVEDAGAVYPPDRYRKMVQDLNTDLVRPHGGVREVRHPHSYDTLQEFTDNAANMQRGPTLYDLDLDRQGIFSDIILPGGNERRFGSRMVEGIDDLVKDTTGVKTLRGTPQEAVDNLLSARDLNSRLRKSEEVSSAITKAGRSANSKSTGVTAGNEMRQKFRAILDNDAKSVGYTPDEIGLMESIVEGTKWGNRARSAASKVEGFTGKSAAAGAGTAIGLGIGGPIGGAAGGFAGLGASGLAGSALRGISERSTRKMADELLHLTTTGRRFATGKANGLIDAAREADIRRALIALGAG